MPSLFEAVIFDNDGLLLDTELAWTRAEQDLFQRYGREFTMEHKRSLLGNAKSVAESKLETMLALPGEGRRLLGELDELVMEEALAGVPPRPGAVELLESVAQAGMAVGLASNSSRAFVERTIGVSGVDVTRFAVLVTADDVARPKPAPDLYLAACAALGADPVRSAALEDSQPGISSARGAGLFVIGVPYFEDQTLEGASLLAASLAEPSVAEALGLKA